MTTAEPNRCEQCGATIWEHDNHFEEGGKLFCDQACLHMFRSQSHQPGFLPEFREPNHEPNQLTLVLD